MKKKLVVFHPAIAPYRVDFFNSLDEEFDATFYFEFGDVLEQSFTQDRLRERLRFTPRFLAPGLFGIKNLRTQVLSILWKEKPDIVFCSEYNLLGILLLIYKFLFDWKLRILTICDDSRDIAASPGWVKRITRAIAVRFYSGIILTNDEVMTWYKAHFHTEGKFLFFPIIQEDEGFRRSLKDALPVSDTFAERFHLRGKQVVLFVGRLIGIKNLFFLIDAFAALADKYPKAVLLLVGDGEQCFMLDEHADHKGLIDNERVLCVGKKEGRDLYACYNVGQMFVLPSYYERFGAVVNEALLAGCYTLCSSVAGAACLIEPGKNGDIFDPHRLDELVEKLDSALAKCVPLEEIKVKENRMERGYEEYMREFLDKCHRVIESR